MFTSRCPVTLASSIRFGSLVASLHVASCRRSWKRRSSRKSSSGATHACSQSAKYFDRARSSPRTKAFLRASAVVGNTQPHRDRGSPLSSWIALGESGTVLGNPFLVAGKCAVRRSRFTCFQRNSKISPRRMAVSIAN